MTKYKEKVKNLASELLQNEVIFKSDLEKIFGERKWKSYEEEKLDEIDRKSNTSVKIYIYLNLLMKNLAKRTYSGILYVLLMWYMTLSKFWFSPFFIF